MTRLMPSSFLKFPILRYDDAESNKQADEDAVLFNNGYAQNDRNHDEEERHPASPAVSRAGSSIISDGPTFSRRSSIDFELIDDTDSCFTGALTDDADDDASDAHDLGVGETDGDADARPREHTTPQKAYPRISRPVELLRPSYDCIVIGSGYGGGVAASRMARAGQSVCLLERGEEKWPGEYPATSREAAEQFHFSGDLENASSDVSKVEGGNPTGLYHLIFGRGQSAIVGNGLGGTSLINANVFLEADERLLSMDFWPAEIRKNPKAMKKYYQAVKDVLEPEAYPYHWPALKKMQLFERQAKAIGMSDRLYRVPQTTRFRPGPNSCGVSMNPSTLTGQDAMGINDGSKTTTLVTYLADAWNWGAEMFCQCEVRHIEKASEERGGGYIVYFAWHGHGRERFEERVKEDLMWVHARKAVFLGAGAIGTTEILLRSKAMGLSMSDRVGQGMSGNGDMLAFSYNTDTEVNAVGRPFPCPTNPVGPTITSIIDYRKGHENPLNGFVIQEGAIPQGLCEFLQAMMDLMPGRQSDSSKSLVGRAREAVGEWKSRLLGPFVPDGAIEKTQVFLIMSHDGSQATLSLKDDKPVLEFVGVGQSDRVKQLNKLLARATAAVGGTLVQSPFYAAMGQQQITVHPLGGANMSPDNTGAHGVTNHIGEVFTGDLSETHSGLIVVDGALVPNAIGVNPFATIAALAERSITHYAGKNHLVISEERNGLLDLYGEPAHVPRSHDDDQRLETVTNSMREAQILKSNRLDFVELLSGFIHEDTSSQSNRPDQKSTYERAYSVGKGRGQSARLFVNVAVTDPEMLLTDEGSRGILTGTFVCPAIKGSPFMVLQGDFGLFKPDEATAGTSRLTYDFDMVGVDGRRLHFHAYKLVDPSVTLDPRQLWHSTTTLYVSITERLSRTVLATGILSLGFGDLFSEFLTLTSTGTHLMDKAFKVANFVSFFALKSASFFLAPLAPLQYPVQTYQSYVNYTPPTRTFIVVAEDGIRTEMHMWEPSPAAVATGADGRPVEVQDLFMIPGASVDHQIYSLPTIPFNAVNYFTRAGYRVFVTVHRIGMLRWTRGQRWTTYDARLDIKACLERIRGMHAEPKKVYTIAHCMGSVAFSCGLLDGSIPASWILGITCSQVFMNPIWARLNMAKATSPLALDRMYTSLLGDWLECTTSRSDTLPQQALNQALRFYPEERAEMCASAACHRTTLLFGRCWSHRNLNEATHRNIDRFFGGSSMVCIDLLKRMGSAGRVSTNAPACRALTTDAHVARLRGIPFLLFSGADSAVLSPAATEKTFERLRDTFGLSAGLPSGGVQYRRRVVPGYGHLDCWMGKDAWRDVYPFVREEVDRVVRGEAYRFCPPRDRFARMIDAGTI